MLGWLVELAANLTGAADSTGNIWQRCRRAFQKTAEKLPSSDAGKHDFFTRVENESEPRGLDAFEGLFGLDGPILDVMKYRWAVGEWTPIVGDWVEAIEDFSEDDVEYVKVGDLGQVKDVDDDDGYRAQVIFKVWWKRTGCSIFEPEWTFKRYDVYKQTPFLIFSGPPGAGKTDVARRTARAWGVPLLLVEAAHVCGNASESPTARLQELGEKIKDVESCVVLFDEIDHFIAGDSLEGEGASVRSQFRQLVDALKEYNVLLIYQLHRIEKDMLSRAEVIHFHYPPAEVMQKVIELGAPQLEPSASMRLAMIASSYGLGPRDMHQCAKFVDLHCKMKGAHENNQVSLYSKCYSQRYGNYHRFGKPLAWLGEPGYLASTGNHWQLTIGAFGGILVGALLHRRFGHVIQKGKVFTR